MAMRPTYERLQQTVEVLNRIVEAAQIPCPTCDGGGFSRPGSGYDAVCDDCTGGYVGYATGDEVA